MFKSKWWTYFQIQYQIWIGFQTRVSNTKMKYLHSPAVIWLSYYLINLSRMHVQSACKHWLWHFDPLEVVDRLMAVSGSNLVSTHVAFLLLLNLVNNIVLFWKRKSISNGAQKNIVICLILMCIFHIVFQIVFASFLFGFNHSFNTLSIL